MVSSRPGAAGAEQQVKPSVPATDLQTGKPLQRGKHLTHLFHANFSQLKNHMICIFLMTRGTNSCNDTINPPPVPPDQTSSVSAQHLRAHTWEIKLFFPPVCSLSANLITSANKTLTTLPSWTNTTAVLENISWTAGDHTSHQKQRTWGATAYTPNSSCPREGPMPNLARLVGTMQAPSPNSQAFFESPQCWLHAGQRDVCNPWSIHAKLYLSGSMHCSRMPN